MVDYMPEDNKRVLAAAIKGFYIHFFIFSLVIAGLFVINLLSGGPLWVQWPTIGWGIGILAHAYAVFAVLPKRLKREASAHRQFSDKTKNPHQETST